MSRYRDCLPFVLRWEGGYVNDPADPGGATNKGVTQAVYDAWRAGKKLPKQSVRLLTSTEVEAIYEARYWNACKCGGLPAPVDLVVFDSAVNCGVDRACRWLQRALGVAEDGDIGPRTLAAVKEYPALKLAAQVAGLRGQHYLSISEKNPKLGKFLNGWNNRLGALREEIA